MSEITRRELTRVLEGRVLVPDDDPGAFIAKCAGMSSSWAAPTVSYGDDGGLYKQDFDMASLFGSVPRARWVRVSLLKLLEENGFFKWPDKRVFLFLEQLVHPVVRKDEAEQHE